VIYPAGQPWEHVPKIEEGANIYMGQTMLLMPDLAQMQVKLGIREAYIDRMNTGLKARVALPNRTLDGEVDSVASVAKPAAWWNGNTVRYDTIVKLPSVPGLRPGMSAEVEVTIDRHEDVLTIPVAAVVETAQGAFCWVKTPAGAEQRSLQLGDTNDRFTVVKAGLQEGDEVVLHPFAFEEARALALQAVDEAAVQEPKATEASESPGAGTKPKSPGNVNKQKSKPQGVQPKQVDSKSKEI
jgi:HlyD family secretion protein